jgi:protocatechuate 3,4-dioxygenase beta subunit
MAAPAAGSAMKRGFFLLAFVLALALLAVLGKRAAREEKAPPAAHAPSAETQASPSRAGERVPAELAAPVASANEPPSVARTPVPGETRQNEPERGAGTKLRVSVNDQYGRAVAGTALWLVRRPEAWMENCTACYLQPRDGSAAFEQRTDEHGRVVFENVPPGTWWLGPRVPGIEEPLATDPAEAVALVATPFELSEFEDEHDLGVSLDRGLYLRGRLVDSAGVAVSRAGVGCEHESVCGFVTGDVAEDGSFALGPVAAGVSRVHGLPHGRFLVPEPVRAEPDGREIVITLSAGARLAGLVVDASSGAPARADVLCSRAVEPFSPHGSFGDDGRFQFSGLEPGTYALVARTQDGRAGWIGGLELASEAAREDVRLELGPAARLTLRYSGGPERALFTIRLGAALVATGELERGVASPWFAPAGRLRVTLARPEYEPILREVEAHAGELHEVLFELE